MGLVEDGPGIGDQSEDKKSGSVLGDLHKGLLSNGWTNTDYGFSLARQGGAIDVTKDNTRVLYYVANKADFESYSLLSELKLPVFPVVMSPLAEGISSIDLPQTARALDSMKFPDQEKQGGFMGSFEIMDSVAYLLTRIYQKTGKMPEGLRLGKLAIVPGDRDNIRLIPPLDLVETGGFETIAAKLLEDLNTQDPDHEHTQQIEHLKEAFERTLKEKK